MERKFSLRLFSFFTILFLSLELFILISDAEADDYLSLVPQKITFIGEKSLNNQVVNLERALNIIAKENATITNVTLLASTLYSVNTSDSITSDNISFSKNNFNLTSGSFEEVSIKIEISDQKAGVYEGYLFLFFNANRTETIDLQLILEENYILSFIRIALIIATIISVSSLTFLILLSHRWSEVLNLIVSLILVLIGIFAILFLSPFNATVNLALITTLFAPFIGYIISILNSKRDFQNKTNELSYGYRDKMVQEDSTIIREIIGELSVHFAYLIADDWPKPSKIPDEIWKKSKKVGIISDIHTSFLARYYRYIPVYNQCVDKLLELSKKRVDVQDSLEKNFEKLRENVREVETLLYLTLIYDLGLIQQRFLAKELVKFPLHMSELLKTQLVKFDIMRNNQTINREVYSEENAREFTIKMGIEINKKVAEVELSMISFQDELKEIENRRKLPHFFDH